MERFRFDNGVDAVVHGMAMIPAKLQQPAPAVIAVHGWGNSKEEVMMPGNGSDDEVGELLVSRGFVVVAIDSCFQGERLGSGPLGRRSRGSSEEERRKYTHAKQESSLFKLYLWQGRTLWGMMLREMQIVLDYLQTRAEVDPQRIGVVGKSMGCMMSWWLAAIDSRVKVVVGVCGVVRYTQIIAHRANHGIYAYVPGILKHFDTEAIFALSSPRPLLLLSGEEDAICPFDGIEILEGKLGSLYGRLGAAERFRSVVYSGTGHEYLPEMKEETVAWFGRHL
jgi:dienelactone hydrolase